MQILDFIATSGRPFRVVLIPGKPGVRFQERPTVKFYDRTYDFTEHGQFTGASYYAETLLEHDHPHGLILSGGEPAWNLSGADMAAVLGWIRFHMGLEPGDTPFTPPSIPE